jgi:hypothetical protein
VAATVARVRWRGRQGQRGGTRERVTVLVMDIEGRMIQITFVIGFKRE